MVAAAACAFAHFTSLIFSEWDGWVEQSLNRSGWVIAFEPEAQQSLPDERVGRVDDVDYRIVCGVTERMGREALRLQTMLRIRSDPRAAAGGTTCLIRLSLSESEGLERIRAGNIYPDVVLQDAGISDAGIAYTSTYTFLGSATLAIRIANVVVIFVCLLLFGCFTSIRADALRAWAVLKERMYMVLVPYIGAVVVRLVLLAVDRLTAVSLPVATSGAAETLSMAIARHDDLFRPLIYAPVVEEIIFRYALFTVLCRWWSPLAAAVMASAVFAVTHLELHDTSRTITLFASGMLLQWLYVRYRSVILCIAAHGVQNGGVTLARALNEWY